MFKLWLWLLRLNVPKWGYVSRLYVLICCDYMYDVLLRLNVVACCDYMWLFVAMCVTFVATECS